MSQAYSTGLVALYLNTGSAAFTGTGPPPPGPELLGYGETAPRLEIDGKFGQIKSDLTAGMIPYDFDFEGAIATIGVVLTVWNETVAAKMENFPIPGAGTRGSWTQRDYGSLMMTEGKATSLWVRFLFGGAGPTAKATYAGAGLVGGYRFPQIIPIAPMAIEPGTRPMKRQFIFQAWPLGPLSGTTLIKGGVSVGSTNPTYLLWDHNMASVQSLPIS